MPGPLRRRLGAPSPAVPTDIRFRDARRQAFWERTLREVGSGWFLDRFLYLFGRGLQDLHDCLDAWAFLVPRSDDRIILGRNAHGTLLVLEDPEGSQKVCVLDPTRVVYWSDPGLVLATLLGSWLPSGRVPHFLEDEVYRAVVRGEAWLDDNQILGAVVPIGLGGQFGVDNYQEEDIVEYYRSTGAVYAKAFARKKPRSAPKPPRSRKRMPRGRK